jgi:hypothetical protein
MPLTDEQYRLSGTLYVYAGNDDDSSFVNNLPPWCPKDMDWESVRLDLWESFHSMHSQDVETVRIPRNTSHDTLVDLQIFTDNTNPSFTPSSTSNLKRSSSFLTPGHAIRSRISSTTSPVQERYRRRAGAILLLDVDRVEHVNASANVRTLYQVDIPARTYGRISGLNWVVCTESSKICSDINQQ